ncbi:MAG: LptF/LptG family permease [Kiritimatiellae bacterium]|jgi:lipopolysaccharide export system permease protein|nr:LptF/LptG family permease [Kiritimatiellia bacterium]
MTILDRYLLKTFLMPWLSCLLGFTFLFVIVDLVENLDDFVEGAASVGNIVVFYIRYIPSIWIYIGPITLLLGLLYALYQLTRHNEIIAMRASGISLYRVLMPFIILGVGVSIVSMHISRTVAPRNLSWTEKFKTRLSNSDSEMLFQLRYRDPETGRTWDIESLNQDTHALSGVTLIQRRPGGEHLEYVLRAEEAVWIDSYWFFHNVAIQFYNEEGYAFGPLEHRAVYPKQEINESPERIIRETMSFDFMTSREIKAYLRDRPSISDRSLANLQTQLHMRNAHPWLCLVTMLMAVPFGTQTARKGVFTGVFLCLFLFFSLFFMMNLFKVLGLGMKVAPWIAGWAPTLLFGGIGAILLRRLR